MWSWFGDTVRGMSRRVKLVGPLVLWTLFVWSSRIRNIWGDDDLSTGGQVLRTGFAVVFLAFAVVMAQRLWVRRGQPLRSSDRAVLAAFVSWSVGFWLVRGIGIIIDDHTTEFTLIHTALMIVSIGIALVAASALTESKRQDDVEPSISSSPVDAQ